MNVETPRDESGQIRSAIWFISTQLGGIQRVLTRHKKAESGLCAACSSVTPVRWPCPIASMALLAKAQLERPSP
jgi:hypothetical protein